MSGSDRDQDEAAWRDLVARYDVPVEPEAAATPWPAQEDVAPEDRARVIRHAVAPAAAGEAGDETDEDEHFVPPPPPPLPQLDPIAKAAWAGLFGGPGYLLVATLTGLGVPGWAALMAIAAFIGGFATLVIRMGDGPSRGDGPDGGAVL
jgi:hypothetical protein